MHSFSEQSFLVDNIELFAKTLLLKQAGAHTGVHTLFALILVVRCSYSDHREIQ